MKNFDWIDVTVYSLSALYLAVIVTGAYIVYQFHLTNY